MVMDDVVSDPFGPSVLSGLKVAYVAFESLPNRKGSGVRIHQMVRALVDAGAEVTAFGLTGREGPALPTKARHVTIKLLEQNYLSRALAFRDAVARRLYALRPDVIHFRGPFEGQAACSVAPRIGARTIFEVNGLPSVELRYHYPAAARAGSFEGKLRALEQDIMRSADRIVTQSEATRRFIEIRAGAEVGPKTIVIRNAADPVIFTPPEPGPPTTTIRNAADPAILTPPERIPVATDGLTILYAGSLSPWQGLMDLFAAVRDRRHHYGLKLEVIGPGRRRWQKSLLKRAKRLKVDRILTLHEATTQTALAAHVRRSNICVAPLRRDIRNRIQGCSPIKLFEYMAAGRAVLSTDLPCVREIVTPHETGLLARPSNAHRLRDCLSVLAEDPALRARLGKNARQEILHHGTWSRRRAELVRAYDALFAARFERSST